MFQFHNGTINTVKHTMHQEVTQMFQFHNGTINTALVTINGSDVGAVSIPQRYN